MCLKSSRICTGYQRDRIFIINQQTPRQPTPAHTPCQARSTQPEEAPTAHSISSSGKKINHGGILRNKDAPKFLPKHISPHWYYRRQIFDLFICTHIPVIMRKPSQVHKERIWLVSLQEMPSWTNALEASISAISLARLGRLDDNQFMLQESLRLYSIGIMELQVSSRNQVCHIMQCFVS